jgi:hypothetical protein
MPEFFARHADSANRFKPADFADFLRGYMECAEWLWPEHDETEYGFNRDAVRGWSKEAQRQMRLDCRAFFKANAADLAAYEKAGRDMQHAGHDFYLSREGHGTGFWDRGMGDLGKRLHEAARNAGPAGDPWLHRGYVRLG